MGVAVLLVYVMMVLTFNSLITPFIILFTLPLATIGAFPALYLTGRPIGVSALIGFLMLIGIVVTNAIVLLDLVERLRAEGHSTKDALIEGGRTRVRPILMTAIATILALIPLAAGFNQGSIIAAELGTVVIGGLFSATFLTLLVIPVVYSLVDGLKVRVARRLGGRDRRRDAGGGATGWRGRPDVADQAVAPGVADRARSSRIDTIATQAGKISASGSKKPTLRSMTSAGERCRAMMNQRGRTPGPSSDGRRHEHEHRGHLDREDVEQGLGQRAPEHEARSSRRPRCRIGRRSPPRWPAAPAANSIAMNSSPLPRKTVAKNWSSSRADAPAQGGQEPQEGDPGERDEVERDEPARRRPCTSPRCRDVAEGDRVEPKQHERRSSAVAAKTRPAMPAARMRAGRSSVAVDGVSMSARAYTAATLATARPRRRCGRVDSWRAASHAASSRSDERR